MFLVQLSNKGLVASRTSGRLSVVGRTNTRITVRTSLIAIRYRAARPDLGWRSACHG
jgi:hypothetical protein